MLQCHGPVWAGGFLAAQSHGSSPWEQKAWNWVLPPKPRAVQLRAAPDPGTGSLVSTGMGQGQGETSAWGPVGLRGARDLPSCPIAGAGADGFQGADMAG